MRFSLDAFENPLVEENSSFVRYERGVRVTTEIIPAPWSRVFYFALLNAFLISLCRVVWYESVGRPTMFSYHPALEAEMSSDATN